MLRPHAHWIPSQLQTLALPEVGLGAVFVIAFISATLLPLGSEPAVFALVKLNPDLFWPAVMVATAGNQGTQSRRPQTEGCPRTRNARAGHTDNTR